MATGVHLRKLRGLSEPLAELQARLEEAEMRARLAWEAAEILASRFSKLPERHRPHYAPTARFRILEIRSLLAWNAHDTARCFLTCPNTILNWERAADPETGSVGSVVKPTPPIRRAADVVRATVQTMARLGFGGQDLCARVLDRAGWRVSARSVGRYRRSGRSPRRRLRRLRDAHGRSSPASSTTSGRAFTKTVGRLGVVHRLASADNIYATARLERFWRTLKEFARLYRIQLPLTVDDLEVRLEAILTHYLCLRPHEGLKGATPAEAFLGMEPACLRAVEPPRGRPGMGPSETPFVFEQLDERLPILRPAA
jgi:hypothetical protein